MLVTAFSLRRRGQGLELSVSFGPDSPAIWLRQAKAYLKERLPSNKIADYQATFEAALLRGEGDFSFDDFEFPLRFGNGGTLPVVRIAGADYYCLFFRDTYHVGWNIANGGANSLHGLLHPDAIIERELREELIVADPGHRRRYVFDWHDARLHDHPDFALADRLWRERFRQQYSCEFDTLPLPLKWLPAPDLTPATDAAASHRCDSVRVQYAGRPDRAYTGHGVLNINAEDFGIEFDRIAKLCVGRDAVFCDGEIVAGQLLNRVVGLFAVETLDAAMATGETCFRPDRFFWNGIERTGDDLQEVLIEFATALSRTGLTTAENATPAAINRAGFNLCPITRNVVRRYQHLTAGDRAVFTTPEPEQKCDVFVSFGSEDRELARRVFDCLSAKGDHRVFFSDATLDHGPFATQIDQALDSAWALVAVGSSVEHLHKSWVQYEWQSFHNDLLSGRKPDRCPFLAFTAGIDPWDLPRPFRYRQQPVQANPAQLETSLRQLTESIQKPF